MGKTEQHFWCLVGVEKPRETEKMFLCFFRWIGAVDYWRNRKNMLMHVS
ncbi:8659_t:CDS:2 [Racocetra persica]|uniref:8659_t:CDS:1 n=1 Tax=Racocetra persica TaxID=160502 RepID=A0ACA9MEW1_9GLOM|nr:8659_t:CDS:2 [Racocetra persica]